MTALALSHRARAAVAALQTARGAHSAAFTAVAVTEAHAVYRDWLSARCVAAFGRDLLADGMDAYTVAARLNQAARS